MIYAAIKMNRFAGESARVDCIACDNMLRHAKNSPDKEQWRCTDPDDATDTVIAIEDSKFEPSIYVKKIPEQTALALKNDYQSRKPFHVDPEV